VLAAALARMTDHVQLRAGSVALPLHHPIRVAEEWSLVDNLSRGRVGVSFGSGWHPDDFVLAPDSYAKRRELMYQGIETVQKLWRGEAIQMPSPSNTISVKLFPMPMQLHLPIWLTAFSRETYIKAGELGVGVLTNLQDQTIDDLAEKIALYRESLARNNFDPATGQVTILLHTFVDTDHERAMQRARGPLCTYLKSSLTLIQNKARSKGQQVDLERMSEADLEYLLSEAYERYSRAGILIGTPATCTALVQKLIESGVDEIGCFIDFGVDTPNILASLPYLDQLRQRFLPHASQPGEPNIATHALSRPTPMIPRTGETTGSPEPVSHEKLPSLMTLPLTDGQQRLWTIAQLGVDEASLYNESFTLHLRGPLEVSAIRDAFQRIVNRHESLRTTFSPDGETQQIAPALLLDIPLADLSHLDPQRCDACAIEIIASESSQPFDLAQAPLLRVRIVRMDDQYHLLIMTMPHIITDAWSLGIVLQELKALYSAVCRGEACDLAAPVQFRHYAEWLESRQQSIAMAHAEMYWLEQFADPAPVLELPTDHPPPALRIYQGAQEQLIVGLPTYQALRHLATQKRCTLYMIFLAAYSVLLHRLTGQDDIVIGSPSAGQLAMGRRQLTGYCVNMLPLRSRFSGNPRFEEHLISVRNNLLDAHIHQIYPLSRLIARLNLPRDPGRDPLITTVFSVERDSVVGFHDLKVETTTNLNGLARFSLSLMVIETAEGLRLEAIYNTDLFVRSTIQRWLKHLKTIFEGIIADPVQRILDLSLLTETERQQLLVEWNDTVVAYPCETSIQQLFEAQVTRTPDAIALVFDGGNREQRIGNRGQGAGDSRTDRSILPTSSFILQISYAELNARANQLAHHLQALGVGPEVQVGICLERSQELVIGLLSILKVGGSYVPLDPAYPDKRLAFMLEDAGAAVLITQQSIYDLRFTIDDLGVSGTPIVNRISKIVNLDADGPLIARQPTHAPGIPMVPDNLAYVIYTSGSTGKPKGVMNSQRAIINRLLWMQDTYRLTAEDSVLQKTPFSFDVSVWEIFWPLLNGARLTIAQPGGHQDSAYLVHTIAEQRITTLHFVPPMLQIFLEEPALMSCASLRRVICSGEALPSELVVHFFSQLHAALYNLYGPTEAAVDVTFWACAPDTVLHTVPIGRPVANTQLYLLDQRLHPVPIGVVGELYLGGMQLARGYLGRPDLTAERFVPNPFADFGLAEVSDPIENRKSIIQNGTRLYRTGDLARYRSDGAVEFLGRLDDQVKVRGFRIELGEIETVLRQHPAVREAIVLAHSDQAGQRLLAAYIVPREQETGSTGVDSAGLPTASPSPATCHLSPGELRSFLARRLPEYMIPSAFMALDALPLSPNGKIDRRVLPSPDVEQGRSTTFLAPQTPMEQQIAGIWSQLLGIERIGLHDNFFEIGGDSLLAIRLVSRLRDSFGIELAPRMLFEKPLLGELTLAVMHELAEAVDGEIMTQMLEELEALSDEDAEFRLTDRAQ
jgi:amino acid adenylation domain-containing protein/natural product biosynthesis luciferase-like monooxygenase protein